MFKVLINLIPKSVKNAASQISSTRIQSYAILLLIYIYSLIVFIAEIHTMIKSTTYSGVSTEFLTAFFAILMHHLALLGINKNSAAEPKMGEIPHSKEEKEESDDSTNKLIV